MNDQRHPNPRIENLQEFIGKSKLSRFSYTVAEIISLDIKKKSRNDISAVIIVFN